MNNKLSKRKFILGLFLLGVMLMLIGYTFYIISFRNIPIMNAAKNGKMDLSTISLARRYQPVELAGQWNFYYDQLISPADLSNQPSTTINVPGSWDSAGYNRYGFATYSLTVTLSDSSPTDLSLKIPTIGAASKVWVNGKLVSQSGVVGKSNSTTTFKLTPQLIDFSAPDHKVNIVVWASNYNYYMSGVNFYFKLGTHSQVYNQSIFTWLATAIVLGGIGFIGLYHLMLYFFRSKEKAYLLFSCLCLSFFLRYSMGMVEVDSFFFPTLPPNIKYILTFAGLILIIYFAIRIGMPLINFQNSRSLFTLNLILAATLINLVVAVQSRSEFLWNVVYYTYIILPVFAFVFLFKYFVLTIKKLRLDIKTVYVVGYLIFVILAMLEPAPTYLFNYPALTAGLVIVAIQSILLAYLSNKQHLDLEAINDSLELTVKARTEKLTEANNSILRLTNNLSHDLRTPITAIRGFAETMLGHEGVSEHHKGYLQRIIVRSDQIVQLSSNMLMLAKLTEKQVKLEKIAFKVKNILAPFLQFYTDESLKNDITFKYNIQPSDVSILADRVEFVRVFENIMQNALNFASTNITFNVKEENERVIFVIWDDGCGILPDVLPNVFDRYFTKSAHGTGLGLSIVRELVTQMGGDITIKSEVDSYTEVTFWLKKPISDTK